MRYHSDNCAQDTTLGYDVVQRDSNGHDHRLGTYASLRVACATADEMDNGLRPLGMGTRVIDRTR